MLELMSPTRSQIPTTFRRLEEEMRDVMSRFLGPIDWPWMAGNGPLAPAAMISPSVDLSETDDSLRIRMDVPGIKADEINIELSGNTIRVSGEYKEEKEEKGKTFHRLERRSGSFTRALALPAAVKEDKISAECNDGVLTITLPKTETAKTRKIAVKTNGK